MAIEPVRLDMFQNIVNVQWVGPWVLVVFVMEGGFTSVLSDAKLLLPGGFPDIRVPNADVNVGGAQAQSYPPFETLGARILMQQIHREPATLPPGEDEGDQRDVSVYFLNASKLARLSPPPAPSVLRVGFTAGAAENEPEVIDGGSGIARAVCYSGADMKSLGQIGGIGGVFTGYLQLVFPAVAAATTSAELLDAFIFPPGFTVMGDPSGLYMTAAEAVAWSALIPGAGQSVFAEWEWDFVNRAIPGVLMSLQ